MPRIVTKVARTGIPYSCANRGLVLVRGTGIEGGRFILGEATRVVYATGYF